MSKLQLPTVTLCITDCLNVNLAIKVVERCKSLCDFGAVKLLTSIPNSYEHSVKIQPINSLVSYSIFVLTKLYEYIDTPNLLIVQRDGFILNPQSFKEEWLELDFIGPLFQQYDRVGSGGFSLRSRRIMEHASRITPHWDGTQKGADEIQRGLTFYEDGEFTLTDRYSNFKIATLDQAADFAVGGNRNPKYFRDFPFGFHRTHQPINFETGLVDNSDPTRDIEASYDNVILDL